jgi:hypothetical protein
LKEKGLSLAEFAARTPQITGNRGFGKILLAERASQEFAPCGDKFRGAERSAIPLRLKSADFKRLYS